MSRALFVRSARLFAIALPILPIVLGACGGSAPPATPPAIPVAQSKVAPAASTPSEGDDARTPIPITSEDAVRGAKDARVTIVVFSDFQCPYCNKLEVTFDRLREAYPDDLRIVFKNETLPSHTHARLAAEVGQGVLALAGQDAFWRYHDVIFRRQANLDEATIKQAAVGAGAPAAALDAGMASQRWAAKVERDNQLADAIGADGTPSSFVNGVYVGGAKGEGAFRSIIDDELAKAKELEASGTPRAKVSSARTTANFKDAAAREAEEEAREREEERIASLVVNKVPVGASPFRGPATAPVTIVVFSDFQCPYCKKGETVIDEVRKVYGDKVRIVWKDEPLSFHPRAVPAAELARAARAQKGDAGFWTVHDLLFASAPHLEDADLEKVAADAKLDVPKAMAAVRARAGKKAIDEDVDLADDVRAAGTPHFFVNGRRVVGAKPLDAFRAIIDEELAHAAKLVASGVTATKLYDTMMKDGIEPPPPETRDAPALPKGGPFRGAANAKVVIQEVADFECPFCAKVDPAIEELLKAYPGKVKVVWRDKPLPMHVHAPLAAEAAREAYAQKGNEGFAKMQKLLFANQRKLAREDLDAYAAQAGLDAKKFAAALDARTHRAAVEADAQAVSDAGVSGTPAFFVGPYYVSGAQPYVRFRKLVERILAGTPPPPRAAEHGNAKGEGAR